MTAQTDAPRKAEFRHPAGLLNAVVGGLLGGGALVGAGVAVAVMPGLDARGVTVLALVLAVVLSVAVGLLNSWRQPLLVVAPDRLTIPTFFGRREIAVRPGQTIGELLATPAHGGRRSGSIEGNRFVHFFALDGAGQPVLLVALHRNAPMVAGIRRALQEIAGLRVTVMARDPKAPRPRPDVRQFRPAAPDEAG